MSDQAQQSGPYLAVAALCDYVLREDGGTNSLIRIVDRITVSSEPVVALSEGKEVSVIGLFSGFLVVSFRAGDYEGPAIISLLATDPDGEVLPREDIPVLFEGITKGPNTGPNVILDLKLGITNPGYFWFTVLLNERLVTRVPLRVVLEPTDVHAAPVARPTDAA